MILRPSATVNVGLAYVYRPGKLTTLPEELERVDGGTIDGGVSVYPWDGAALFADLRNLDQPNARFGLAEVHLGAEQTLYRLVSLRAGWYRVRDHGTFVYSGEIGVKPWWRETDTARPGRQVDVLAYAFVWQHNVGWNRCWHMMALVIPLVWQ